MNVLRHRLASEEGFTMVELLLVCVILSILTAIAVPTYLQSRDNAYKQASATNVQGAVVAAESYAEDNYPASPRDPNKAVSATDSGFSGMTAATLRNTYDAGLSPDTYVNNSGSDMSGVTARAPLDSSHFCVYAVVGRWFAFQLNPTGAIYATTIPADVCS